MFVVLGCGSLVWLILALILLTTAAYALYHYLYDPGLQSAQDAGLFTDMNMTAQPNLLTPAPPFASGSGEATILNKVQNQAGVSPIMLLFPRLGGPNFGRIAYPTLDPQLFQEL